MARSGSKLHKRITILRIVFFVLALLVAARLFSLQIIEGGFYRAIASGQHSIYEELVAERGDILARDWIDGKEYKLAAVQPTGLSYAVPNEVEDPKALADALSKILGYEIPPEDYFRQEVVDETVESEDSGATLSSFFDGVFPEEAAEEPEVVETDAEVEVTEEPKVVEEDIYADYVTLLQRLSKEDDPYEPVARNLTEDQAKKIRNLDMPGAYVIYESGRVYPEGSVSGQLIGFLGFANDGSRTGYYGIEGRFNDFLSGVNGFWNSITDPSGRWIGTGARAVEPAEDGGDILLTIDRTVQYEVCRRIKAGVEKYQADMGTVVILEPATGRVIAMCSYPNFEPLEYADVEEGSTYQNPAISHTYEPGSIFKPLVMAFAIDEGKVTPQTIYNDTGEEKIDEFTIRNSDLESHGWQNMVQVLEKSLNTGMIFVMRQIGMDDFRKYIKKMSLDTRTGIELPGESVGNVSSLDVNSEIFFATASYGQGITATPLQMASAYAMLANGGVYMKPYIVEEKRHDNGYIEKTYPTELQRVVSEKTANTVSAMLVSVVEEGHGESAAVPGYYLAGKTGTAQVAKENGLGYATDHTKASFAGYGPIDNPKFAMIVMLDKPRTSPWAASTAAPIWGDVAEFLINYFEIIPTRSE